MKSVIFGIAFSDLMQSSIIDRQLERLAAFLSFPVVIIPWLHRWLFYSFLFLAPLIPMPSFFSIGGMPPAAIFATLLIFSVFVNLAAGTGFQEGLEKLNRIGLFLSLFCLILAIDIYWVFSGEVRNEVPYLFGRAVFICIIIATYLYIDSEQQYIMCLRFLLSGIIVLATIAIVSSVFDVGFVRPARTYGVKMPLAKSIGIPMSAGEFGIMMTFALPLLLVGAAGKLQGIFSKRLCFFLIFIVLLAIFVSQSRSTWLATVFTVLALHILLSKNRSIFVLLVFPCCLLSFLVFDTQVADLLIALRGEGIYEKNVLGRLETYMYALDLIWNRPLLGYGHSFYHSISDGGALHNNFLHQAVSCGLLGLFSYVMVFFILILGLIRKFKINPASVFTACLLSSLLGSIIELCFYQGFFSEVLAIEIGFALVISRIGSTWYISKEREFLVYN